MLGSGLLIESDNLLDNQKRTGEQFEASSSCRPMCMWLCPVRPSALENALVSYQTDTHSQGDLYRQREVCGFTQTLTDPAWGRIII